LGVAVDSIHSVSTRFPFIDGVNVRLNPVSHETPTCSPTRVYRLQSRYISAHWTQNCRPPRGNGEQLGFPGLLQADAIDGVGGFQESKGISTRARGFKRVLKTFDEECIKDYAMLRAYAELFFDEPSGVPRYGRWPRSILDEIILIFPESSAWTHLSVHNSAKTSLNCSTLCFFVYRCLISPFPAAVTVYEEAVSLML
jgi:hypothetical protein